MLNIMYIQYTVRLIHGTNGCGHLCSTYTVYSQVDLQTHWVYCKLCTVVCIAIFCAYRNAPWWGKFPAMNWHKNWRGGRSPGSYYSDWLINGPGLRRIISPACCIPPSKKFRKFSRASLAELSRVKLLIQFVESVGKCFFYTGPSGRYLGTNEQCHYWAITLLSNSII